MTDSGVLSPFLHKTLIFGSKGNGEQLTVPALHRLNICALAKLLQHDTNKSCEG